MSVSLFASLAIVSGVCLALLCIFFAIEDRRGQRFAARVRSMLDRSFEASLALWQQHTPVINGRFARNTFRYLFERVLSVVLKVIRVLERYVRLALSLNKKKERTTTPNPSEHLTEIAAHKKSAQLSEKEKRTRKDKALRGE